MYLDKYKPNYWMFEGTGRNKYSDQCQDFYKAPQEH